MKPNLRELREELRITQVKLAMYEKQKDKTSSEYKALLLEFARLWTAVCQIRREEEQKTLIQML